MHVTSEAREAHSRTEAGGKSLGARHLGRAGDPGTQMWSLFSPLGKFHPAAALY